MVRKITKKVVGILLIMILMLNCFAMIDISEAADVVGTWDVSADDGESQVTATLYSDGSFIISGTGNMKNNNIAPSNPYYNCNTDIKTATIESGVTSIGDYAFFGCSNLNSIEIPDSVTTIGKYAFCSCSSLTSIEIPNGVTSIKNRAFYNCSFLTSIEIPSSVTSIETDSFIACLSLISINVSENNQNYASIEGILFSKSKTKLIGYPSRKEGTSYSIPEGVISIGNDAFYGCKNLTGVEIPNSVTSIGHSAFEGCSSLTNINIPEGVTSIGYSAFEGCSSLTNINIPEGVANILVSTFEGCSSLTNINIPEGATSIGGSAFEGCSSLTNINIPEGVTSIGGSAFERCSSLTRINIPEGVTIIKSYTFSGCRSLTNISIPQGVTSVENNAFYNCSSLTSINIPERVTIIKSYTFSGCSSLTKLEIPNSVISIGDYAFNSCTSLTSIEIPEGVTNIQPMTFCNCTSLTNIEIPERVTSIGSSAFRDCTSLTSIDIPEGVTNIGIAAFSNCKSLTNIKIPEEVTIIENSIFSGCTSLTEIEIPNSVTSIENDVFYNCTSLTSIEIPNSVTSIGNEAFYNCTSLICINVSENNSNYTSIDGVLFNKDKTKLIQYPAKKENLSYSIPEGVINIEQNAFYGCGVLKRLEISSSVISIKDSNHIGMSIFDECSSLTNIDVSENNQNYASIDGVLFDKDKKELIKYPKGRKNTSYSIPEGVNTIKYYAFFEGVDIIDIEIPSTLRNITEYTFIECVNLKNIEVSEDNQNYASIDGVLFNKDKTKIIKYPKGRKNVSYSILDGVTTIGDYAFYECTVLTNLEIPRTVRDIGRFAFKNTIITVNMASDEEEIEILDILKRALNEEDLLYANENIEYTNCSVNEDKTKIIIDKSMYEENEKSTIKIKEGNLSGLIIEIVSLTTKINNYDIVEEDETKYIEKILPDTTVGMLKEKIETNGTIEVYNGENKIIDEEQKLGTGMTVKVKLNNQEETYEIVVTGDLTGDGETSIADLVRLARYNAKLDKNLTGAYLRATEIVRDGNIGSISDLVKLSRVLAKLDNL